MIRHSGRRRDLPPGTKGRELEVTTNLFAVETLPRDDFYQYDVVFQGGPYNRRRKLEIIDRLHVQEAAVFNPRAFFDGEKNMFRCPKLPLANDSGSFTVYLGENLDEARRRGARGIRVDIKRVAKINPSSLLRVLNGSKDKIGSEEHSSMTLLNILIRIKPIMTNPSNARSFFVEAGKDVTAGRGLELWRGYFQSVRLSINRLTINVDITTAVMYQGGRLIDLCMAYLGYKDPAQLDAERIGPAESRKLEHFLKSLLVFPEVPKVQGRNPKRRPIRKVVVKGADHYTFEVPTVDGQTELFTISKHFWRVHQYKVRLGRAICIGFSKEVVYPIEVLQVPPGQFYKKAVPSSVAPRALTFATQKPHKRLEMIKDGSTHLGYSSSDHLRYSGLRIGANLMRIPARILPPPTILFSEPRENEVLKGPEPQNGTWNVMKERFADPKQVTSWAVVTFVRMDNRSRDLLMTFLKKFVEDCHARGMRFPNEPPPVKEANPLGDFANISSQLVDAGNMAYFKFQKIAPTFLFVVLPDSAASILSAVKHWGDCTMGVSTQCTRISKVLESAVARGNQYRNNLALKLNMKLGGYNWYPSSPDMSELRKAPTMVVGADVSHGSPDSRRPSVAGLVTSYDKYFSRYVGFTSLQESRQERIMNLEAMFKDAVMAFVDLNNKKGPSRIIFYRDGLSEGQLEVIAREEVRTLKNLLQRLTPQGTPVPKLTFIVVGKRHHVRFFPERGGPTDQSGNCPPGLIVDKEIVHPIEYDFYLQSQAGLLGTSRSGHYTVIQDDNGIPVDALQSISFSLCHGYGRATRSVSIPAPVYHADLVCGRGQFHSLDLRDGEDTDSIALSDQDMTLDEYKRNFLPIHRNLKARMYWM